MGSELQKTFLRVQRNRVIDLGGNPAFRQAAAQSVARRFAVLPGGPAPHAYRILVRNVGAVRVSHRGRNRDGGSACHSGQSQRVFRRVPLAARGIFREMGKLDGQQRGL